MTSVRSISLALAVLLAGLIVWAFGAADFFSSFAVVAADPWGLVALVDLYIGFFLFAAVIWAFEERRRSAVLWTVALFLLGNVVAALWVALKLPELYAALRG